MSVSRPHEALAPYARLQAPYTTPLSAQLKGLFGDLEATKRTIAKSYHATSQLGEWCADHIWELALEDEQARKIERTTERLWSAERQPRPVELFDAEIQRIRQAQDFVKRWQFPRPSSVGNSISPKVLLLKRYLDLEYERSGACKSIVFVRRRYTARVLTKLFARIGSPHLRLGLLIGTRYGDAGDVKISFREQVLTLQKFRNGEINCLFATSIAEEGLDIPDCNKVFRFDLYDTLIQYIQSRGRARHRNSTYVHFVEAGNRLDLQAIQDVRQGEAVMRRFCEALPADRLLQGNDYNLDTTLAKEKSMRRYTDPETGATLTYTSALVILQHFVGCLVGDPLYTQTMS